MLRSSLSPLLLLAGLGFIACQGEVIVVVDDDDPAATSTGMGGATSTTASSVVAVTSIASTSDATTISSTTTSSTTASTSSGGIDCFAAPDCFSCFCDESPAACEAYITGIIDNIYCGESCELDCTDFCADPDQGGPSFTCDDCVNGGGLSEDDIDAFVNGCSAAPGCAQFANDVQNCPF